MLIYICFPIKNGAPSICACLLLITPVPYNAPGSSKIFYKFLDEERKWTKLSNFLKKLKKHMIFT